MNDHFRPAAREKRGLKRRQSFLVCSTFLLVVRTCDAAGDFATVKGDSEVRNMVQCGGKSRVVVDHVRIYTMEMEIFMRSDKVSHEEFPG